MLKAIVIFQSRSSGLVCAGAVEQAWQRLNSELLELQAVVAEVHGLRSSLQTAHQKLSEIFGKATEKAISAECRLRYALDRITNRIANELVNLPRTTEKLTLSPPDPDAVLNFLNELRTSNDPRLHAFEALFDLARRERLEVRLHGDNWHLLRDGVVVASTGGTTTRVDALVPIDPETSTRIRPKLERVKNDSIIIDGSDVQRMVARLEERLAVEALE
jgi:hypothetical protein